MTEAWHGHRPNFAGFSENIETVRKERVFDDEVTEEEMAIIQKRVALQQRQVIASFHFWQSIENVVNVTFVHSSKNTNVVS